MPHFITCVVPEIIYLRGQKVTNNPINIDMCKNLRKGTYSWYPDNTGLPSIIFEGCDAAWIFKDEKTRDEEFDKILLLK